jgi:hypothetical protein
MASFASLGIVGERHLLVPNGADLTFDLLHTIREKLRDVGVPGLSCSVKAIASGTLASLLGRSQDYLVVAFDRFPEHSVLVGATEIGAGLEVSFYVVASTRFGRRVRRAIRFAWDPDRRDEPGAELSFGDAAALGARVETVRYCLEETVKQLTVDPVTGFDLAPPLDENPED